MVKINNSEVRFYESLKNIFIGAKVEGISGYINLMKIKSKYFDKIFILLKKDVEEKLKEFPEFKEELYNKLYSFFKRYFSESGSVYFVSTPFHERIYEKVYTDREDVSLFWKTHMLYYVKTDRLFKNMSIEVDNYKFFFDVSKLEHKKAWEKKELIYELKEVNKDGTIVFFVIFSEKGRKKMTGETISEIIKEINKSNIKINEETLEKAFRIFEKQSEVDYFINKNAKQFLKEQFDLWLYQYVYTDETQFTEKRIKQLKVLKEIAYKIIDFISQFEDELVRIWNKPKFVLNSNYVITLDRIVKANGEKGIEIIQKIINHKNFDEQVKEWKDLKIVDDEFKKDDILVSENTLKGKSKNLNSKYQFLPIDTKHFKDLELEILSLFDNLDEALDGWLIKSENYQALNTILPKFKEKVQTIYIDPPFNKEQDADYFYSVKFKDATWITMLENRLRLAKDILKDTGSIFVRCDYNGNMFVRLLMNEIFGEENFRNEIIVQRGLQTRKAEKRLLNKTDSLFFYFKDFKKGVLAILETEKEYVKSYQTTLNTLRKYLREEEVQRLENYLRETLWMPFLSMPGEQKTTQYREIFGIKLYPPKGRHWAFSQENLNIAIEKGTARLKCNNCGYIITNETKENFFGKCPVCGKQDFTGEIFSLYNQINNNWTDIPGYEQDPNFPTRNSEILLKRVIESTSNEGDLVMDFFLGSGTTTAVAHKLKRKWIGIEVGEHFWTVVLPRMKKVLAYDKSGISKEKDVKEKYNEKNAGGFFKYQILEQYEDTLDNIELKENQRVMELFKDDYLLKYFLDFETRESPYLLNIDGLKNPFAYKLKVNLSEVGEPQEVVVDIPETFNYLLGLNVKKIKTRTREGNSKKYLFILGEKEGKNIAIVWREYDERWSDEDFKKDKEFIIKELEPWTPHIVYTNGQSILTPKLGENTVEIRYIEPEFKKLMEE